MKINTSPAPVCNDHHLNTVKHKHAISIALLFVIGIAWIACGVAYAADKTTTSTATAVKWHPGHYYTLMGKGKDDPKYMAQVYRELKKTPALRGIQIRYEWAELEPEENVYDFTSIEQHLAELAAQKKRLIILLQTKSFDPQSAFVPDYLKEKKYDDGVFPFSTFGKKTIRGYNLKLWNPLVQDRIAALMNALGKRFNAHPYFEGIGLTETAFGQPMVEISNNQLDNYYSGLLNINQQLRKSFPNTMTYQFTNYPRPMLKSFVGKLKEMGTGLGGPDVFIDEPGLHHNQSNAPKGVYHHYPELSGIVPLTPSVMQTNYANTRHDKTGKAPTVAELFSFARDRLKANYIFWTRAPGYFPKVLEMLNGLQTGDPAGGLDATCPKAYPACID
ncbi:beta-galactosidase [Nitrosomonas sp.]|uniref:beta-galactosidase n=1 Tax=Nitrosomonas sp. TaxID=42353 RepID=UPI0026113603|nr:beta-galactosidase [Nitrosomonas sp.]